MTKHEQARIALLFAAVILLLVGCARSGQVMDGEDMFLPAAYTQISQEEAGEMMGRDDGHVVVDVRRQDEYDAGHIPGAILIPNESIGTEPPEELPDLNQIILIYCRTGNRICACKKSVNPIEEAGTCRKARQKNASAPRRWTS